MIIFFFKLDYFVTTSVIYLVIEEIKSRMALSSCLLLFLPFIIFQIRLEACAGSLNQAPSVFVLSATEMGLKCVPRNLANLMEVEFVSCNICANLEL